MYNRELVMKRNRILFGLGGIALTGFQLLGFVGETRGG